MTAWDVEPGRWQLATGVDRNGDDEADGEMQTTSLDLERGTSVVLTLSRTSARFCVLS